MDCPRQNYALFLQSLLPSFDNYKVSKLSSPHLLDSSNYRTVMHPLALLCSFSPFVSMIPHLLKVINYNFQTKKVHYVERNKADREVGYAHMDTWIRVHVCVCVCLVNG